ncbi:ornithine cyclodeaminase [Amylibacter sp. SFDW26]|uniref:ornithine cyclodeaminase family protein n=1 Tax=Amylibacter sp. SFDW26 TaxID=2652722 RepID=UPI0012627414|nr:ornithine cyclodeaminase [Amylibacter sp. SFDW26]KAB7614643.1 ornithine cyclodeaminase [Amylibacter sp. SFDW26]
MTIPFISFDEMDPMLEWTDVIGAIEEGHKLPKASVADGFAYRGDDTLLSRSAWIDGLGVAIKGATIMPSNIANDRPMVNGGVMLFDDETGELEALVDFHLVTKWKTAGDSLLGAKLLARTDSNNILVVGAGTVSTNMIDGYSKLYPDARFQLWNRSSDKAVTMAKELSNHHDITPVTDLKSATEAADIINCATMSSDPVVDGAWLQAGQHLNLIGAYRPDMRETNDAALTRSRIFVDSRETTIEHIGELKTPIADGVISANDVIADYYDITSGAFTRQSDDEINLFKNGGGAHLDLMTAKLILKKWYKMKG